MNHLMLPPRLDVLSGASSRFTLRAPGLPSFPNAPTQL